MRTGDPRVNYGLRSEDSAFATSQTIHVSPFTIDFDQTIINALDA